MSYLFDIVKNDEQWQIFPQFLEKENVSAVVAHNEINIFNVNDKLPNNWCLHISLFYLMTSHLPLWKSYQVTIYRFFICWYFCVNKSLSSIIRNYFKNHFKHVMSFFVLIIEHQISLFSLLSQKSRVRTVSKRCSLLLGNWSYFWFLKRTVFALLLNCVFLWTLEFWHCLLLHISWRSILR